MKKAEYRTPNIKMVEFKVERGFDFSVRGVNRSADGFSAVDPATDGSEQYSLFSGPDWNN